MNKPRPIVKPNCFAGHTRIDFLNGAQCRIQGWSSIREHTGDGRQAMESKRLTLGGRLQPVGHPRPQALGPKTFRLTLSVAGILRTDSSNKTLLLLELLSPAVQRPARRANWSLKRYYITSHDVSSRASSNSRGIFCILKCPFKRLDVMNLVLLVWMQAKVTTLCHLLAAKPKKLFHNMFK